MPRRADTTRDLCFDVVTPEQNAEIEMKRERLLQDNVLNEMWSLFYLSNLFLFPMYAGFEEKHEITRPEFVTLYNLHHLDGLIARDISTLSGLPKNSISRGVKRLSSKGLIEGRPDNQDRRRMVLRITDAGRDLFATLLETASSRRQQMIAPLSPGERAMLKEILLKLARNATKRLEGQAGLQPA